MPGTNLSFPYDEEIFNYRWENEPDVVLTNMLTSGAMVRDAEIEGLIANGSNFFTVPFYNVLGGTPQVYNGVNDFVPESNTGDHYAGCVFGRMQSWSAIDFIKDFNSGADPMASIVSQVAKFWTKFRQTKLINILTAIFGIAGDTDWDLHTYDIAVDGGGAVADANLVGATTLGDAMQQANGDNSSFYSLAIMHSKVATRLNNLQLLEYAKYTDSTGIQRPLPIAFVNGLTIVINDNVPVADSATAGEKEYTTYVMGQGAIRYAVAPVDVPSEVDRDPKTKGGMEFLYTRVREAIVPAGFSFKGDYTTDVGIPDAVLEASASYERKMPHKSIFLCKVLTNG